MKIFRCPLFGFVFGLAASSALHGQTTVVSGAVGFNRITCLRNSDTIVGVPFLAEGSSVHQLAAQPVIDIDSATLSLTSSVLEQGTLGLLNGYPRYYARLTSGSSNGAFFTVTANAVDSLTVDLNGGSLSAVAGDSLVLARYWTLDTLFPPAGATTSWTQTNGQWIPNGHAIVASASALSRRTEVLLPNLTGQGINRPPAGVFYITGGSWRQFGVNNPNAGSYVIYPDSSLSIRHNSTVSQNTFFRSVGDVDSGSIVIPLTTRSNGRQDNHLALPRPVPVRLIDLGLDTTAFVNSPSTLSRRDELLVFNNAAAGKNKPPIATYFRLSAGWRMFGAGSANHDTSTIPAGSGFIIRKYNTADGATVEWDNPPNY
jgi:uncharacterized protein (TIGR02597 family)